MEQVMDLRNIVELSPLFGALPSTPAESILARSAKQSSLFEVRMIVVDVWATGTSYGKEQERGGFEIRRTDWVKVKERIRKYTSFYWDGKTIYAVSYFLHHLQSNETKIYYSVYRKTFPSNHVQNQLS